MRSYRDMRRLLTNGINLTSISTGTAMSLLVAVVAFLITVEVIRRYAFHDPSRWSLELVTLLTGAAWMLTGAYTFYKEGHIRMDLLAGRIGTGRMKAIIELVSTVLFVIFVVSLMVAGWDFFWTALVQGQTTTSQWKAPIWPAKLVIPVGAFLLLLQAVPKFLIDVELLIKGKVEE